MSEEPNVDVMSENLRHLVHEAAQLKAENARLRELIGRLYLGDGVYNLIGLYPSYYGCVYCHKKIDEDHKPDCPWLEARKVLEER